MSLQTRLEKLERSRRPPVADPGDLFDTALMLTDPEAIDLACEQVRVLFAGGDFEEVGERLNARMAYLRKRRGATDGSGN